MKAQKAQETKARMDEKKVVTRERGYRKSRNSRTQDVVAMVQGVSIQESRQEQVGVRLYPGCLMLPIEQAKRLFSGSLDRLLREQTRVLPCLV